jgi:hypothetical protein
MSLMFRFDGAVQLLDGLISLRYGAAIRLVIGFGAPCHDSSDEKVYLP